MELSNWPWISRYLPLIHRGKINELLNIWYILIKQQMPIRLKEKHGRFPMANYHCNFYKINVTPHFTQIRPLKAFVRPLKCAAQTTYFNKGKNCTSQASTRYCRALASLVSVNWSFVNEKSYTLPLNLPHRRHHHCCHRHSPPWQSFVWHSWILTGERWSPHISTKNKE